MYMDERNTSAYAEKTHACQHSKTERQKHLRLRGENPLRKCTILTTLETPPLTRRKRKYLQSLKAECGNTSAYAEKTHERGYSSRTG